MSYHLLDLPTEIIEECLGELLPPISVDPNTLSDALLYQPEPRDLCRMLSVCRVLNRLASPWIWRRFTLTIADEFDDEISRRRDRFYRWKPLCDHPELATHTRVLFLDCAGVNRRYGDGVFNPQMLLPALRLMNNIRVFSFERDGDFGKRTVLDEVFTEILSKPSLHTMIATYLPWNIPPLNPLTQLSCINLGRHELLRGIKAAPYLESLAISYGEVDVDVLELIPWTTLRQLGFCNTKNWARFLDGFASWSELFPHAILPLEEISIYTGEPYDIDQGITSERIFKLCVTCEKQNLTSLSLSGIRELDEALFSAITVSFTGIQKLGLSAARWSVGLGTIEECFGKLATLKSLCWNYTTIEPSRLDTQARKSEFRYIVPILSRRCQALEHIIFYFDEACPMSYWVTRDGIGRYESYIETQYPLHVNLFSWTSSWDARRYDRV